MPDADRRCLKSLGLAVATLLALAGCAAAEGPRGEIGSAAVAELARRPANYVNGEARAFIVSRDGRVRGLLWGTMHVDYDGDTALPRPIRAMFAAAQDLHVETVVDHLSEADAALLQHAAAQLGEQNPAALARLDAATRSALSRLTLPDGSAPRSSLRALSRLLSTAAEAPSTLPSSDIVDVQLIAFARWLGKPVQPLDATLPLFSGDPNSEDAADEVRQAVRRQDGARRFSAWVRAAYARGEVALTTAALVGWRSSAADLRRNDQNRAALFSRRNAAWIRPLESSFAEAGTHFAAFGAGHLIGEDGVVALLRARGWTVAPCVADRCAAR